MPMPYLEKIRREFVEEMEKKERDILRMYIQQEKGELKVDWSKLIRDKDSFLENASEGVEPIFYNHILRYLEIKDILTFSDDGTFTPFGCGMDLGPNSSPGLSYRFRKQEDAEAYARAEFSGALYNVGIVKLINSKVN
jgi:hypothetical protein